MALVKWSQFTGATLPLTGSEIIAVAIPNVGNYKLTVAQFAAQVTKVGSGSPSGVVTPIFTGQLYIDTGGGLWYATGLTNTSWNQFI